MNPLTRATVIAAFVLPLGHPIGASAASSGVTTLGRAGVPTATVSMSVTAGRGHRVPSSIDPRYLKAIATGTVPLLYVSEFELGTVVAYPTNTSSPPTLPVETISNLRGPNGIAVDALGNLYVVEELANDVKVFAPGMLTASKTLTATPGSGVYQNVAVDSHGTVYVTTAGFGGVKVYANGATTPTSTLNTGLSSVDYDVAVDGAGNVFETYASGGVQVGQVGAFPKYSSLGTAIPTPFIPLALTNPSSVLANPEAIAIDKSGNLLVANNAGPPFTLAIYAPETLKPAAFFALPSATLGGGNYVLALTSGNHHVFVAENDDGFVSELAYPSGKLESQIKLRVSTSVFGIATSPASPLGVW